MKSRPCESFEPGQVTPHRCRRCHWTRARHTVRRKALCHATGKVRHWARASASTHLNRLAGADRNPELLMVYLCQHCGYWHVGHSAAAADDIATSLKAHQRVGGES
jgi:hypothetical protein